MKHKESSYRVCGKPVEPAPESKQAQWALCLIHACIATEPLHQRVAMQQLVDGLRRETLTLVLDAAGSGWLRKVELQAPPKQAARYDNDGTPRYIDTASPHGFTIRPGVDNLVGGILSDRLEKLREPAGDDDAAA
jgi:hypothetical protein